jgi:hypothetical protein
MLPHQCSCRARSRHRSWDGGVGVRVIVAVQVTHTRTPGREAGVRQGLLGRSIKRLKQRVWPRDLGMLMELGTCELNM